MGKRERTRAHIQRTAIDLFLTKGYDNTTVEQIAAASGVTSMTFFRHFPSKDSVVLDDPYDPVIAASVATQPNHLAAMERVRRGFSEAWTHMPETDMAEVRERVRIAAGHAALRAKMWENNLRTQRVVVDALLQGGGGRLEAEVAAGACLGALMAALLDWGESEDGTLSERISFALEQLSPSSDATVDDEETDR